MKRLWTFYPIGPHRFCRIAIVVAALSIFLPPSWAQAFTQQGPKLVGTGAVGGAEQGWSAALSGDGNTAIVGGPGDNSWSGAAWVFTRAGGVWSQQGSKLVGTGAVGPAFQGWSVALSNDGNTAIVGGYRDNGYNGAAWVFTRSGGVWSQQGSKLVGTGGVGQTYQGWSVGLSADGNTAIVGGSYDMGGTGAAWVFTRSGDVWNQQGSKLVGTGAVGAAAQGNSVALSADGNTAIVGGPEDNPDIYFPPGGAAWVFTRSGGVWNQQGSKLVGTGAVMGAAQGNSVALSADGNTAMVGGGWDHFVEGAAWVFTRSDGEWSQQGSKLVGTGAVGPAGQGWSVALSADGNVAIVGGPVDSGCCAGAAWAFTRSGGVWSQWGGKLVGSGAVGGAAEQGHSVALSADGITAIVGGPGDNGSWGAAWVYTAPARVKLNVTTTPGSGLAGTYVNIIGSGFPKGTLNPANVKVDLAASCGGPPLATTRATSVVPIIGTSDRIQFRIPGLAPGRYYVAISDLALGDAKFSSSNCSMLTVAGL
jgi:hypothetical protein